jgi:hypothetical protein
MEEYLKGKMGKNYFYQQLEIFILMMDIIEINLK